MQGNGQTKWKCEECGHEQEHPSTPKYPPRCDECFGPMRRVQNGD